MFKQSMSVKVRINVFHARTIRRQLVRFLLSLAGEATLKSKMADFRESVLPVVFNSLFSEKNGARDIQNTVDVIIQNQMLNVQVI